MFSMMTHDFTKEYKWRWWSPIHSDIMYTSLSLIAKTSLVWLLYAGSAVQDPSKLIPVSDC